MLRTYLWRLDGELVANDKREWPGPLRHYVGELHASGTTTRAFKVTVDGRPATPHEVAAWLKWFGVKGGFKVSTLVEV